MQFLVVGGGSMGKRRTRCLLANGVPEDNIHLVDVRQDRREEVQQKYGVTTHASLDAGMATGPDAVIVSVPGAFHMDVCLAAARAARHFFCEVPLALDLSGTEELIGLVERHRLIAAPGTQPPFHPLIKKVKEWLKDPTFGRLLMINEALGSYLPGWHPYEDYRSFYASKQEMGGGNLDIVAQQLASLYWVIEDRIERVMCRGSSVSTLEIEGSDCWQVLGQTAGGVPISQWYDLIQRSQENTSRFISEQGTIEVDLAGGTARRYLASSDAWESVGLPEGFEYEQCYIEEIALFISCISEGATWHNQLATAIDIVRFLLAMQSSNGTQTWVEV